MSNYYFIYHLNKTKINQFFIYNKRTKKLGELCNGKIVNNIMSYDSFKNIFNKNNGWNVIPINKNDVNYITLLSKSEISDNEILNKLKLYEWQI